MEFTQYILSDYEFLDIKKSATHEVISIVQYHQVIKNVHFSIETSRKFYDNLIYTPIFIEIFLQ